jgi:DNA invertase Pin-like site-specific DNA recombinase
MGVCVRLIGYTRSSDRREDRESHKAQEQRIRAWCRANGHRLVRVISEPSGTKGTTIKRPGWADALNALEDGQADGVVVRDLERLSRDVLVQEQLLRDAWELDKEVLSTAWSEEDLRDDPEDPTRRLIRIIIGAVHAHNRDMTVLRMHRGKRRKQQRGGFLGGTPRYGYQATDKELLPDPAEQAAIRRIRRLHRDGRSLREIVAALDAEGIPAKRGGSWHPTTVARTLRKT